MISSERHDHRSVPFPDKDAPDTHASTDDPQETINAHICFDLEDKPKQLLKALSSLTVIAYMNLTFIVTTSNFIMQEILSNINIKNIKIGPLQDNKVRRIYIENESQLSEEERKLINDKMTSDGSESGQLEVFLESEAKFISTRSEGIILLCIMSIKLLQHTKYGRIMLIY